MPKDNLPPRISLAMIARNEAPVLERCLASTRGAVDEICLVDTGSTDATPEIARRYGARVQARPWTGDFAAARNDALAMATGDWVLSLDADEQLLFGHDFLLRACLAEAHAQPEVLGVWIWIYSIIDNDVAPARAIRLFRRVPWVAWQHRVHEEVFTAIVAAGGALGETPVGLLHFGYPTAAAARQKAERNLAILDREPLSSRREYHRGRSWYQLQDLPRAQAALATALALLVPEDAHGADLRRFARGLGLLPPEA